MEFGKQLCVFRSTYVYRAKVRNKCSIKLKLGGVPAFLVIYIIPVRSVSILRAPAALALEYICNQTSTIYRYTEVWLPYRMLVLKFPYRPI